MRFRKQHNSYFVRKAVAELLLRVALGLAGADLDSSQQLLLFLLWLAFLARSLCFPCPALHLALKAALCPQSATRI